MIDAAVTCAAWAVFADLAIAGAWALLLLADYGLRIVRSWR